MQVRWLTKALRNLDGEAASTARDDPVAARLIVQRIRIAIEHLATNPGLGYPGRIHGTRELLVPGTRYGIPYRVSPRQKQIEILRVFHTSRRPPQRW